MIGRTLRFFGLGDPRYLVLLGVGALAASAAVWGMWGQAQRETLAVWAAKTCAAAGVPFDPRVIRKEPPTGCRARVAALADGERAALAFRAELSRQTTDALLAELDSRLKREAADAGAARRLEARAAQAAEAFKRQEKELDHARDGAEAEAELSADWWAAYAGLAGVRPPSGPDSVP